MSEMENALAETIKKFAEQDEQLRHLYVELKDLESVSQTYQSAKIALDETKQTLDKVTGANLIVSEMQKDLFQRILELTTLTQTVLDKLSESEIRSFREKLDGQNEKLDIQNVKIDSQTDSLTRLEKTLGETKGLLIVLSVISVVALLGVFAG